MIPATPTPAMVAAAIQARRSRTAMAAFQRKEATRRAHIAPAVRLAWSNTSK